MTDRFPEWLNSHSLVDSAILNFLNRHRSTFLNQVTATVQFSDFEIDGEADKAILSRFVATKDSLFYAKLLKRALESFKSSELLVDLGTGSAIPLISAMSSPHRSVRAIGVDLDDAAVKVARSNVAHFGMSDRIEIIKNNLDNFLRVTEGYHGHSKIVASNPPYVSCPDFSDDGLMPVNGGSDGTHYLQKILAYDFPDNSCLAIQWGSITNPVKMFDLIESKFQVLSLHAWEVPFGNYTRMPHVNSYLVKQRDNNLATFGGNPGELQTQLIFGAVLVQRKPFEE